MEYTTPNTPQLNGIVESRLSVIKKGKLEIILDAKLNDTAQKMMWTEAVHTYERVQNNIANTGSNKSPFEIFYMDKPNIIDSFSEFGHITYVTKREKI